MTSWRQSFTVAIAELKRWRRDSTLFFLSAMMLMLAATALFLTMERNGRYEAQQQRNSRSADEDWRTLPDRHPHRVVHFGDFVFKPTNVLAAIDWGVESHAGRSLFLEGHRQNTANFSESSQSGALLRFGQLTPALVVQKLVPLVLIFLGFAGIVGERESGTLRQLIVAGADGRAVIVGKVMALFAFAALTLVPIALAIIWSALWMPDIAPRGAAMLLAYVAYLALWCTVIVLVSTWARSGYASLLLLLSLWVIWCVVLPRAASTMAALAYAMPSRVESEMRAERALKKIGDSHNPEDPHFAVFKARVLQRYGVERIEDLPVNYGGLLMIEGERLTSEVYDKEARASHRSLASQNRFVDAASWSSPAIAISTISRALAATDYDHHRHFVEYAERRRYAMVQALNELHAQKIAYQNDRDQRLAAAHWHGIHREQYRLPGLHFATERIAGPAIALLAWLGFLSLSIVWRGRRMEREA